MVWRTTDDVCFASDSRLSFGLSRCDAAIKVSRIPFKVFSAGTLERADLIASGDLGMAFAGSANVALMTKDALAEVVRTMQGIPGYHDIGMDGISDVVFRGFKVITQSIGTAIGPVASTCVVFAGYCASQRRLRVFRMEVDRTNSHSIREILSGVGDLEVFGTGTQAARLLLPMNPTLKEILGVLQAVIKDPKIDDVGGNIQFGHFYGSTFQPLGVAELGSTPQGVHYWRGPLDLNGPDFDQENGLLPQFPYLNLMEIFADIPQ